LAPSWCSIPFHKECCTRSIFHLCIGSLTLHTQWLGARRFVLLADRFRCVQIHVFLPYQLLVVDAELLQHLANQGRFFLRVTL